MEDRQIRTPAYQVLADVLRARIMTGDLTPGQKLPAEPDLSIQYGVSRSTVREALRVLASQNLVSTTRGVSGGSFVAWPDPDQISTYLAASLRMLAQADHLTIPQLVEARDLLEVPAVGLAAVRRSAGQLDDVRSALFEPEGRTPADAIGLNKVFHLALLRAAGSPMVEVLMRPVLEVVYDHLVHHALPGIVSADIDSDQQRIYRALEMQDSRGAQDALQAHLSRLRSVTSKAATA